MNHYWKLIASALFATVLVFGCRKDVEDQIVVKENPPAPVVNVYGNIFGLVVDANDNPVVDATVSYGGEELIADENGLFVFKNIKMNANGTYVKITKGGYFNGSRRLYPRLNATSYLEVKLLKKTIAGTVDAQAGGTVGMPTGAKITLPGSGGIVDANGNAFTGTVNVAAQWLNPLADDLYQTMPGSLEALDENGQRVVLNSFGMLAVELESQNGAPLNLGNGATASLVFPVPSAIIGNAPATIPLWYFDETTGLWKEEGTAQLVGNEYVGEVSHFSFWNCDVPYPLVNLSGCFEGFEGTKLANSQVVVSVPDLGASGATYTDDNGCFNGLIPQDEVLNIQLIGQCGSLLYEAEIGPFGSDADLGTINLPTLGDTELIFVQGTLVDCDGGPLAEGVLRINSGSVNSYFFVQNGEFSVPANICPGINTILLSGHASDGIFIDPIELAVADVVDAGIIEVCPDPTALPDEYLKVNIDGDSYIWDLGNGLTHVSGGDSLRLFLGYSNDAPFDTTCITIIISDLTLGANSPDNIFIISISNFNGLFDVGDDINVSDVAGVGVDASLFISSIGDVGEPVIGIFSGVLTVGEVQLNSLDSGGCSTSGISTIGDYPVEIEFKVIR